MIKLVDLLKEIADSPYTLSAPSETKYGKYMFTTDYYFTTDNKREYYVRFSSNWKGRDKQPDQKYNWATELTFFPKKTLIFISGITSMCVGHFGPFLLKIIGLKTPLNYSASVWSDQISVLLCEGPKPPNFMIS